MKQPEPPLEIDADGGWFLAIWTVASAFSKVHFDQEWMANEPQTEPEPRWVQVIPTTPTIRDGYPVDMSENALNRTPLYARHAQQGAKLVPFAGWEMPLHFGSILEEHQATRTSGSIFDVSHMGRLSITGPAAESLLERVVTRKMAGMKDGQARYGLACQEDGGTIDDLIVNRMGPEDFLVVCNGANREAVVKHLQFHNEHGADVSDDTMGSTMVAVQGPVAVQRMTARWPHLAEMKRYRCGLIEHGEHALFVARTGYTGEDGFEIIAPSTATEAIMEVLDDLNQHNVVDAGLGARDSLRLEAAMPLYGHELSETKDPISAGLRFAVTLEKDAPGFVGQEALRQKAEQGVPTTLVGLNINAPRAARQGAVVKYQDDVVGEVTSGVVSPTLQQSIAMAMVDTTWSNEGTKLQVEIGRSVADATVVPMPFYKRS